MGGVLFNCGPSPNWKLNNVAWRLGLLELPSFWIFIHPSPISINFELFRISKLRTNIKESGLSNGWLLLYIPHVPSSSKAFGTPTYTKNVPSGRENKPHLAVNRHPNQIGKPSQNGRFFSPMFELKKKGEELTYPIPAGTFESMTLLFQWCSMLVSWHAITQSTSSPSNHHHW